MLSGTWNRYHQTFAAPHNILRLSAEANSNLVQKINNSYETMLLVQPRKRTRAIFEQQTTQPYQTSELQSQETVLPRNDYNALFANEISTMSLEQLQSINTLVSNRIQIKKRYNNTPLRRIINRQVLDTVPQTNSRLESDTFSQTDTLVHTEPDEVEKESPETIQTRYNSTPLRRILSRQVSPKKERINLSTSSPTVANYEGESPQVRRARYNDTPLRRILSRQSSRELHNEQQDTVDQSPTITQQNPTPTPIPRSNTPLRRILSRQVSHHAITTKEDDELSERADSVISPSSPIRSRSTQGSATVHLNSEETIRAYEEGLWKKSATISSAENGQKQLQKQEKHRPAAIQVTVTELTGDASRSKRLVVDSKGSPLKRILQRQNSKDWKAPARVAAV